MTEQYKNWLEYYKQKGLSSTDLRVVSGYDHSQAQLTDRGLSYLIYYAANALNITRKDRLLDVGCGAGLLTRELALHASETFGIDANMEMVRHMEPGTIKILGLAQHLPLEDMSVDKIFCHSIFQYFPNLEAARKALQEFRRVLKPDGSYLIMDVPDNAKKTQYLQAKTPDSHNLQRLFYEKSWFLQQEPNATITDHFIPDYGNSRFRFNVLVLK